MDNPDVEKVQEYKWLVTAEAACWLDEEKLVGHLHLVKLSARC